MASGNNADDSADSAQDQEMASSGQSHFRFLDLAAELRNRIYFFACGCDDETLEHNLSTFKTPTIAQASVQLRREALPIFFAGSSFYVSVFSNANMRVERYKGRTYMPLRSQSGTLGIKQCLRDFMRKSGNTALFRDVTFEIYPSDHYLNIRRFGRARPHQIATLKLEAHKDGGSARLSSDPQLDNPASYHNTYGRTDYGEFLGRMKTTANAIVARDGFNSFTLIDLGDIARNLRRVK